MKVFLRFHIILKRYNPGVSLVYIPCFLICRQYSRATLTLVKGNICRTFSLLRKRSSWTQPAWLTVTSFSPLILVKVVPLYSNESSLCHRETGERRKKRAAPCGRSESLISGFISVHLQKNNESHENQKTRGARRFRRRRRATRDRDRATRTREAIGKNRKS